MVTRSKHKPCCVTVSLSVGQWIFHVDSVLFQHLPMNNWWKDDVVVEEEQDRSLPVIDVIWPVCQSSTSPPVDQMLDDEELPELSSSSNESNSLCDDDDRTLDLKGTLKTQAEDVRNASRIPTTTTTLASRSQSLRTPHHKKFLSRSHNSLVFPSPDYSKVESKVRKYIDSMKEQQQLRRQRNPAAGPVGIDHSIQLPTPDDQIDYFKILQEEVVYLRGQLIHQEAKVQVLQENHDHLLLENARLLNAMDEMRAKIRNSQFAQQDPIDQSLPKPPEVDLSSRRESRKSCGPGGLIDPSEEIQLGQAHETLSITSSTYLELPPFGQSDGKGADDVDTSSCDSSWNSSICRQYQQSLLLPEKTHLRTDKTNIINTPEESLLSKTNDKNDLQLLKRLKELTLTALELRDQTRSVIRQINWPRP